MLVLVGCATAGDSVNRGLAELTVCSPDGGDQVLIATAPDAFPEGALLDGACVTFQVEPGTWYVQVSALGCEGPWEEVEVDGDTEHTAQFEGCLG